VLVALGIVALGAAAWALTHRDDAGRPTVPVLEVSGAPEPEPAPPVSQSTQVNVAEVTADGGQSVDVSVGSTSSAPPAQVEASASVDQATAATGTQATTGDTVSEQHSSTSYRATDDGSSVSVEVNKSTTSNVVTSAPETSSDSSTKVVSKSSTVTQTR
jgi:hypothetical protein